MKIGIISDTHDHHENVLKAIEVFKERKAEYIFHAGDIISPFVAEAFAEAGDARFIAVFGNNDGEKLILKDKVTELDGEITEDPYKGEIAGRKIFMTHKPSVIDEVVKCGKYDLVIYGHTHKQDIRKEGDTLIINPGDATDWVTGESDVVIVELDDMSYEVISLA